MQDNFEVYTQYSPATQKPYSSSIKDNYLESNSKAMGYRCEVNYSDDPASCDCKQHLYLHLLRDFNNFMKTHLEEKVSMANPFHFSAFLNCTSSFSSNCKSILSSQQ